jgi:hypothetical protein
MPGVAALLARLHRRDLAWNDVPESTRAKIDDPVAARQSAARRSLLDRQNDKLNGMVHVEARRRDLVPAFVAGRSDDLLV